MLDATERCSENRLDTGSNWPDFSLRLRGKDWQHVSRGGASLWLQGRPRLADSATFTSADQLLGEFLTQGREVFSLLRGAFALILRDTDRAAYLLSDRFSTIRLYHRICGDRLRVSDQLAGLFDQNERAEIEPQSLISYLFHHMIPSPATLYIGCQVLEPSRLLIWQNNQASVKRSWQPAFGEATTDSVEHYAAQLRQLMEQVVGTYVSADQMTGCFLSGGLDSSSVAGLSTLYSDDVSAFSIGFPVAQYNEIEFARTAVSHFNLRGYEYFMTPEDVVEALPHVIVGMDQPFGNSSVMPTYFCARMARDKGMSRLLAGDGGDELFAGNERYAKQLRLERWRRMTRPLNAGLMLFLGLPEAADRFPLTRKARSLARQLQLNVPQSLEYFNFLNLLNREAVFSDSFAANVDLFAPDDASQRLFEEPEDADTLDRMLYLDWKHTLADNDLIKVGSMCRLAGIDVAYPMLDDRLVDFAIQVPSAIKLTPKDLRHLYKRAMRGFLPEKIIKKPKHGFGLPFGIWTKEHPGLQRLAYEAIDSLQGYGWFRDGFIDQVRRLHSQDHAKHYGELVWVLMVLALWLDRKNTR